MGCASSKADLPQAFGSPERQPSRGIQLPAPQAHPPPTKTLESSEAGTERFALCCGEGEVRASRGTDTCSPWASRPSALPPEDANPPDSKNPTLALKREPDDSTSPKTLSLEPEADPGEQTPSAALLPCAHACQNESSRRNSPLLRHTSVVSLGECLGADVCSREAVW